MLRMTMRGGMGLGVAAAMACGAMWLAPASGTGLGLGVATGAACPPSEGELDLMGYDLSGDGVVQLPEGVRWRVMPTQAGASGGGGGLVGQVKQLFGASESRPVTMVLEDPSRGNQKVLTVRLTALAASEVQEWLGEAVESQQKWVDQKVVTEQPGMSCQLDARQCRAAADKGATKATMPRMYVSVASATGQHGWSLLPAARGGDESSPEAERCWKKRCNAEGQVVENAAPTDQRITLRAYQLREEANQPVSVKMDVKTAKKLASDLKEAMEGKTPAPTPAPAPAVEKAEASAKGVS